MATITQRVVKTSLSRFLPLSSKSQTNRILRPCRLYSDHPASQGETKERISKAMIAYLKRAKAYEEFIKEEEHQFNIGRRHLANMMGADPDTFTQEDIDKSIRYLLPSGLHEPKARPIMRPPQEVFPKTKDAEFDETGRPYHYMFYTTRPNYYSLVHDCADILKALDRFEDKMIRQQRKPDPEQALNFLGSEWLKKDALEKQVLEKLLDVEYEKFIDVMDRISTYNYAYRVKDFIFKYRFSLMAEKQAQDELEPIVLEDGRRSVTFDACMRKSSRGKVTVTMPGTGKLLINGRGIDYFRDHLSREQILFPLIFTDLLGKVDIEAEITAGGPTGQAGAARHGIAVCLKSFVDPAMAEEMRLAGLLTRDARRRERKKPGQEGARRKYTWKKR